MKNLKKKLKYLSDWIAENDDLHSEIQLRHAIEIALLEDRVKKLEQSLHQFPVQAEPLQWVQPSQVPQFGTPIPQQPHEFASVPPKFRPLAQLIKEENERISKAVSIGQQHAKI